MRNAWFCCQRAAVLAIGLIAAQAGWAQQPTQASPDQPGRFEVVLRISEEFFDSITQDEFEYSFPINRTVEKMPIKGHVEATSRARIRIVESDSRAELVLTSVGQATSRFVVDAGPAKLSVATKTDFTSSKPLYFDGNSFSQDEATASTQTCARQTGICSRNKGLIGCVVKKVGKKIARKNWGEVTRQVDDAANEYIVEYFETSTEELLKKLEGFSQFDETVDVVRKHFPELETAQYYFKGTEDRLYVGLGQPGESFPDLPPGRASIELWIKTRPIEAAFLQLMSDWNVAHDLLRTYVSEEEAKQIADELTVETMPGWTVLRIGMNETPNTEADSNDRADEA